MTGWELVPTGGDGELTVPVRVFRERAMNMQDGLF
jgi:hypothetical protein